MRSLTKINITFLYLALLAIMLPAISAGQAFDGNAISRVELLISDQSRETAESTAVYALKHQWVAESSISYSDFYFPCFLKNTNLLCGADFKFYKVARLDIPLSLYSYHQKLIPAEDPFHLA